MTSVEVDTLRKIYYDALVAIGARKSYTFTSGGVTRTVTYLDAAWVQKQFAYYDALQVRNANGQIGMDHRQGVPIW